MSEIIKQQIEQKESQTPRPSLLDVVKVDGRWAQVVPGLDSIAFLDEKTGDKFQVIHKINWDDYEFERLNDRYVSDLMEQSKMTKDEYEKIHWGHEQQEHPEAKGYVVVFGEYRKKKNST